MRIYLAAPWIDREKMPELAAIFQEAGHEITHPWWHTPDIPEGDWANHEELTKQAQKDKRGVEEAQLVVVFNTAKSEGKAVEQGIAIALRKIIIAVGKRGEVSKNVFHYLPNYVWTETVNDALDVLNALQMVYTLHEQVYAG